MRAAAVLALLLALAPRAQAAASRPLVGRLSLAVPFAGFQAGALTRLGSSYGRTAGTSAAVANVTFAGAALGLELAGRFAAELGFAFLLEHYQVRVAPGVVFTPLDRSLGGRGWTLQVPLLLGYLYHHGGSFGSDSYAYERAHYLTLASGLDATYWLRRHFGLAIRLRATGLVRFAGRSYADSRPPEEFRGGLGLGLEVGFAF